MILTQRRGRRRLGIVSTMVNGGLTYGSPAIPRANTITAIRPVGPARPVNTFSPGLPINPPGYANNPIGFNPTPYQGQPIGPSSGYGGSQYIGASNPTSQNNLAQLTLLYQANPSSLTAQQWSQLQAAGVISPTVPYSNASLVNPNSSSYSSELAAEEAAAAAAATTSTTTTAATPGLSTTLETDYSGIPLYAWLGGGVLLIYLFMGKRR